MNVFFLSVVLWGILWAFFLIQGEKCGPCFYSGNIVCNIIIFEGHCVPLLHLGIIFRGPMYNICIFRGHSVVLRGYSKGNVLQIGAKYIQAVNYAHELVIIV